ncbi:MAG: protein-export chaperone SecB [Pseudomonadota bacterium]
MTNAPNGNGSATQALDENQQPNAQLQVMTQYIKDLSFENPNIEKLIENPGDQPELAIEVNVTGKKVGEHVFESGIEFTGKASNDTGMLYTIELVYAGLFQLNNIPTKSLEAVLLVNCPMLLFPYMRRIIADITREGGFPPLALDPIDFAALYMSNKKAGSVATSKADD